MQKVNLCDACSKEKGVQDPTGFALADLLLGIGAAEEIEKGAPTEKCVVCGASPVQTVLYPVPVHFRGSGFYSTDYGRGGRKKEPSKDSSDSSGTEKKDKPPEKKAAEA